MPFPHQDYGEGYRIYQSSQSFINIVAKSQM